mgnify:CR=1 FL=1
MSETRQETGTPELTRIEEARTRGPLATLAVYMKLSGPGWLQSAITLGGGSLASALYLGVLTGYSMLWLQPVAMLLGIVMLSAIAYVTLSTGKRPFQAINEHVNPVLGWGWIIAVAMANVVWSLPQFALGTAALHQNLFPELLGGELLRRLILPPAHPPAPGVQQGGQHRGREDGQRAQHAHHEAYEEHQTEPIELAPSEQRQQIEPDEREAAKQVPDAPHPTRYHPRVALVADVDRASRERAHG